ncbi:P1 family peptidase [Amaricoccus macauensis]|uniref:P1 family peptidase n=1 Tax=Amaricoccus macauensis TaxID=57001 RepID=UPI003C7B9EFF
MKPGARNLITDVEGLLVGNASDEALKSGVTVLTSEQPFVAAVDVRGGAPGTRETDLLAPGKLVERVDALVLSGGSAFGLDAASGVSDVLRERGRGFRAGPAIVPIVPSAILFDLANGGRKDWVETPYRDLGTMAYASVATNFSLGSIGAGTGAMAGGLMGGLGSASIVTPSGFTVGALVAVNAFGNAVVPSTRHFWAAAFEIADEFGGLGPLPQAVPPEATLPVKSLTSNSAASALNTTIAIVATDAELDKTAAHRMAETAHGGLARALVPSHTPYDGDLVFAAATGSKALPGDPFPARLELEHAASLCLARAIARGVYAARPMKGNLVPCWCELPVQDHQAPV